MRLIVFLSILGFLILNSCTQNTPDKPTLSRQMIKGETMGSTFSLVYMDSTNVQVEADLQNLFLAFEKEVSTYNELSTISKFNQGDTVLVDSASHFARIFDISYKIYKTSNGWFNPTVMPLVNYWGFGYKGKKMLEKPDGLVIKELLTLVQFDSIRKEKIGSQYKIYKQKKGVELDFNAIAPGDAVDEVAKILESKGIYNYFIEIGGEIRAKGRTSGGHYWRTAIRTPLENSPENQAFRNLELRDMALATSGNYENYHQDNKTGMKYAHTMNPFTGYPEKNSLLSASVFAPDCGTADALATSFMAMGVDKAFELATSLPGIEVYFIYSDTEGNLKEKYTKGAETLFEF